MHGHHVVEDLKCFLNRQIRDSRYKEGIRAAIDGVKSAQHFYLGPYEELIQPLQAYTEKSKDIPLFSGICGEHIRLPYESCWFEFEDKSFIPGENKAVPKRGLLVNELEPYVMLVTILNWTEEFGGWTLNPQRYLVSIGRTFGENSLLRKSVAEMIFSSGGNIEIVNGYIGRNIFPIPATTTLTAKDSFEMGKDDHRDLFVLNSALMLLSCKNVIADDHYPSDKLNKKRRKNQKQELFKYKTLVLKLPADNKNKHISSECSGIKQKIHLCRGHFKLYTEDAPLFGRYTGFYWWDAHLRGDKDEGLLVKDYEVSPRI